MFLAGKLTYRGRLNAVAPGLLVHIVDQLSGRRYLIDTGASYSIFPHVSRKPASGPRLTGPAGQLIRCWGERELTLSFHGRRFKWTFLLAEVQFAIVGVDFLRHFQLLVDPAASRLIDTKSQEQYATVSSSACAAHAAVASTASVTGPQTPVLSHQSSATVPQPPVLSHRSSVTGPQHRPLHSSSFGAIAVAFHGAVGSFPSRG
jgi:hypothetical protein